MLYLLTVGLLSGFVFPKSKRCFYIVTVCAILMLGGYNGSLDLMFYREQYDTGYVYPGFTQKLFSYILNSFHNLGVSFSAFHLIYTAVAMVLIAFFVNKMTKQPAYAMSVVCPFAFVELGWQMKYLGTIVVLTCALFFYTRIYDSTLVIMQLYSHNIFATTH